MTFISEKTDNNQYLPADMLKKNGSEEGSGNSCNFPKAFKIVDRYFPAVDINEVLILEFSKQPDHCFIGGTNDISQVGPGQVDAVTLLIFVEHVMKGDQCFGQTFPDRFLSDREQPAFRIVNHLAEHHHNTVGYLRIFDDNPKKNRFRDHTYYRIFNSGG